MSRNSINYKIKPLKDLFISSIKKKIIKKKKQWSENYSILKKYYKPTAYPKIFKTITVVKCQLVKINWTGYNIFNFQILVLRILLAITFKELNFFLNFVILPNSYYDYYLWKLTYTFCIRNSLTILYRKRIIIYTFKKFLIILRLGI